jgi:gliding motility-associated-like protein
MRHLSLYIVFLLRIICSGKAEGQTDANPPVPPVLDLVTINQSTGNVEISWSLSPSPDVSGYVVYLYRNKEGYALDTIHNPFATKYLRPGAGSSYFSESFVVAAIDSSGNISPLSNVLNTIYVVSSIDTCKKRINIQWNSYPSLPKQVQSYSVFYSVGGSGFTEAAQVTPDKTDLSINDFTFNVQYCFIVRANLESGLFPGSNKNCLLSKMQRPPEWINADYATVTPEKEIVLSFKIDPSSEIRNFRLDRKTGSPDSFQEIYRSSSVSGSVLYNDGDADITKINYYRLSAINNCNTLITSSNIASNIVLSLERKNDEIKLMWNPYKEWKGEVGSYKLYASTGGVMKERAFVSPADTALTIHYSDLMYEVTGGEVCFMIMAVESSNPHGVTGESRSSVACIPVSEVITVPNTFTPDNNGVNDLFGPVLSFTPSDYLLIITDLQRKTLFESSAFEEKWDGTRNGDPLPEGVYLWFLKVRTPSGKEITRTGSVAIIFNR